MPDNWTDDLLADIKSGSNDKELLKKYPQLQNDGGALRSFRSYNYFTGKPGMDSAKALDSYPELQKYFATPKTQEDFTKPLRQKEATESTGIKSSLAASQDEAAHATSTQSVQEHFKKAADFAGTRLEQEIKYNDNVIPKVIARQKASADYQNAAIPTGDQPLTGSAQAALALQSHVEQQVSPDEVENYKQSINDDPNAQRGFLNEVMRYRPDKKAAIQQNLYISDRANSDYQGQNNQTKVIQNADRIAKGELEYSNGMLIKPENPWESFLTGINKKMDAFHDYSFIKDATPEDRIKWMEDKIKSFDPDEPVPMPKNLLAEGTQAIGSQPVLGTAAGKTAGLVTGLIPGAEEFAPVADKAVATWVTGDDFRKMAKAQSYINNYAQLRRQDPNMSLDKVEALADKQSDQESMIEGITGGLMMLAGGELKPVGKLAANEAYKTALGTALNSIKKAGTSIGAVSLSAALSQDFENQLARQKGIFRSSSGDDLRDRALSMAFMEAGALVLGKGGEDVGKPTQQKIKQALSEQPPEVLHEAIGEQVHQGNLEPKEAAQVINDVNEHRDIDQTIRGDIPDETRLKIQRRIIRRSELETELEQSDKAYHPEIKEKIKNINDEIVELSKEKKEPEPSQKKITDNANQEQRPAGIPVRNAPGDSQANGRPDEGQGTIPEETTPKSKLIEVRHGLTAEDKANVVSGQNDIPLDKDGIDKASKLADDLKDDGITKVISSSTERSKETGAAVAGKLGIPHEQDPRLNAWNVGDWQGAPDPEWKKAKDFFINNPDAKEYEGKKIGESFNQFKDRVQPAREDIEANAKDNTLLINHSDNIMLNKAIKENGGWNDEAKQQYLNEKAPEPAELQGENKPRTFDERVDDFTNRLIAKLTPNLPEGVQKMGVGLPELIKGGAEAVKIAHRAGVAIKDAVEQAYNHVKRNWNKDWGEIPEDALRRSFRDLYKEEYNNWENLKQRGSAMIDEGKTDDNILAYYKRKGLSEPDALAALGDAKANPIDPDDKQAEIDRVSRLYNSQEDSWLGRKDINRVNSKQEARAFQDRIKQSVKEDTDQKGVKWQDVDQAIHIYLDLKRNPEHLKEFYDKLTPEQQKIVTLSQNLNKEQKGIANDIENEYEGIGAAAKDAGLIKEALDNYVARAWDISGKPGTEEKMKFKTSTKHSMERTLDTILEGQAEGMNLKIKGATNNLQILKEEIGNVVENKRLLEQGLALKYFTGEKDANGKPIKESLFTVGHRDGYSKIENPNFKKWTFSGNLEDYEGEDKTSLGRRKDVIVNEDGTVLKKEDVYAPAAVAKSLNNILSPSRLASNTVFQGIAKFNQAVKVSILSYSGFHYVAFTRAHFLTGSKKVFNPIGAYQTGLSMLAEQNPHLQILIENGLTIGRQQDFLEGVNSHNTWLGKQIDKVPGLSTVKNKIIDLNTQMHRHLFETYGAGLKAFDAVNLYKERMNKNQGADTKATAASVAKLMNDTYGGINWERMRGTRMQDPTNRAVSSLLLLAPDWTASNLRFAKKMFSGGQDGMLYRKAWTRTILRGLALHAAANSIMALWDDKDDQGNPVSWPDAMKNRLAKAWDIGHLRSTMVDISPLYHFIGGDETKRAYFSVFGAYTDPLKMLTNPFDFLDGKMAFLPKVGLEALTSQNWQHREFTTLDELTGMDDKGTYTKTQAAHAKGDLNPATGQPYVRTQKGYKEGEEKGGKMTGELTKWPQGGAHPLNYSQYPSFMLSQVRGMMPNIIANSWQLAAGENDATSALLSGAGTTVLFSKDLGAKKDEVPKGEPTFVKWKE